MSLTEGFSFVAPTPKTRTTFKGEKNKNKNKKQKTKMQKFALAELILTLHQKPTLQTLKFLNVWDRPVGRSQNNSNCNEIIFLKAPTKSHEL